MMFLMDAAVVEEEETREIIVWSKYGVYAGDVCWINTIKESKNES